MKEWFQSFMGCHVCVHVLLMMHCGRGVSSALMLTLGRTPQVRYDEIRQTVLSKWTSW